tara:strand:- start:4407 stop:5090 length:684 start_codon:yes stop_codon:yes gene_type:complete
MRKDMDKVLVTTPRSGSSMKNGEIKQNRRKMREGRYDELSTYSSMKPKSRKWDDRKMLNEYLNPLIRYLQKNCGRPWDKVYSDICKNMDKRGTVQAHIFQHLFDYVERYPVFRDGEVYSHSSVGLWPLYKTGYTFYVDRNGTLKEPNKRRPPWKKESSNPYIIKTESSDTFFIQREKDGVWFEATMKDWDCELIHKNQDWIHDLLSSNKKVVLRTLSKKEKKINKLQ